MRESNAMPGEPVTDPIEHLPNDDDNTLQVDKSIETKELSYDSDGGQLSGIPFS